MRCGICDVTLSPDEIKRHPGVRGGYEPCGHCLEVIADVFEPDSEEEIDEQLAVELFYEELQEVNDNANENALLNEKIS